MFLSLALRDTVSRRPLPGEAVYPKAERPRSIRKQAGWIGGGGVSLSHCKCSVLVHQTGIRMLKLTVVYVWSYFFRFLISLLRVRGFAMRL